MARLPRLSLAGQVHLVVQRAHHGALLTADDADRRRFLDVLREAAISTNLALHAYALLPRHFLLLATPQTPDGLSRAMQSLGRSYVAGFNRRHGRTGTLWQGRFRATVLDADAYLVTAMTYVELEPVHSGEVAQPEDWTWSSVAHHLGRSRDPLITDHPLFWRLGNTPFEREAAYRARLEEGLTTRQAQALRDAAHKGWALGSGAFLDGLRARTERPVTARKRGRPRKEEQKHL
jgi:putative transposase